MRPIPAWCALLALMATAGCTTVLSVYPGAAWSVKAPEELGLASSKLDAVAEYLGGRGCIARHGYLVHTWGDVAARGDVASAAKPWFTHFLVTAVEEGLLAAFDAKAGDYEPCLNTLNPGLDFKDRAITFRHLANQISCYGVSEAPGAAFDYNDFQMALFIDMLFLKVYGSTYETVDAGVLEPRLTRIIQCEDAPTFMAFGTEDRPGRVAVSPRDFARFGLLYMRKGRWNGRQLIAREHAQMVVSQPVPNTVPRTKAVAAEMCPGQRTLGSRIVPDNQTDHYGSYSWLWWINGLDGEGNRRWPHAPPDTFAALGHKNGMRGMAVIPSLDIVISWNDTTLDQRPQINSIPPLDEAFRLLCEAVVR